MTWLWVGLGLAVSALLGRRLAEPGWFVLRPVLLAAGVPWPCVTALGGGRMRLLGLIGVIFGAPAGVLVALELHAFWTWRRGRRRARRAGRAL